MGQQITVTASQVGDTAIFTLDRSLTGQDGQSFSTAPPDTDDPVGLLASRLLSDEDVTGVHVLSNAVTVTRRDGWDDSEVARATHTISNLLVYYQEEMDDPDQKLRDRHYNATITHIRAHGQELWVLKVRSDEPIEPYKAGQYTTLGLGYWEPRADDASEDFAADPGLREKMIRRSYSVASSIVDEEGELQPAQPEEVEFYVVQVRPGSGPTLPALTPRLFTRTFGDRIYMGRKFTGRYTLDGVSPTDNVVFLSTGTGEAPQNAMVSELLRRGHEGRILSVVCVRYRSDLAYLAQQEVAQARHPSYKYLALTTREPENAGNKVYVQDLILAGGVDEALGAPLDPDTTHVYLCGNPSMIGIPEWDGDGNVTFPEQLGVCQILTERGFKIDRHRDPGNLHYEEYW